MSSLMIFSTLIRAVSILPRSTRVAMSRRVLLACACFFSWTIRRRWTANLTQGIQRVTSICSWLRRRRSCRTEVEPELELNFESIFLVCNKTYLSLWSVPRNHCRGDWAECDKLCRSSDSAGYYTNRSAPRRSCGFRAKRELMYWWITAY